MYDDIIRVLKLYEKYTILWNLKRYNYLNNNNKTQIIEKLKSNLKDVSLTVYTEQLT